MYLTGVSKIAHSGSYRAMLVAGGAIPVLRKTLATNREQFGLAAIDEPTLLALEHLALDEDTAPALKEDGALMEMLEMLKAESPSKDARRHASGSLFVLSGIEGRQPVAQELPQPPLNHHALLRVVKMIHDVKLMGSWFRRAMSRT